jgi:hypothetical protein
VPCLFAVFAWREIDTVSSDVFNARFAAFSPRKPKSGLAGSSCARAYGVRKGHPALRLGCILYFFSASGVVAGSFDASLCASVSPERGVDLPLQSARHT